MFGIRNRFKTGNSIRTSWRERLCARPVVQILEQRTLLSFSAPLNLPTGPNTSAVAVGDFNGDGVQDLAVVTGGINGGEGPGVDVLLGNGEGTFRLASTLDVGPNPFAVAVGHFHDPKHSGSGRDARPRGFLEP
jgi:hypothetical protein